MTKRSASIAQAIIGTAAAVALLYFLRTILIPLVLAFVLAVLVDAVVRFVGRQWPEAPRWLVSLVAGLLVVTAAAAGLFFVAQGAVDMVQQGPALVARLEEVALNFGRSLRLREPLHLSTIVGKISVPQLAGAILSGAQSLVTAVLLMVVYFGFMFAGRRRIGRKIDAIAGSSSGARRIRNILGRIAVDIETYVWVQTVTGAALALASAAVMTAVGLDNVMFWTSVLFLLTFIPNIGVTIGSIVPSLFALLQFTTAWQAIVIFAGIQIVAFIIGNLIYPKMQAETQNIDPVVTILALSFWTLLWGISGAFLAVPLTLMLMMAFAQFPNTRWVAAMLSNDGRPDFVKRPKLATRVPAAQQGKDRAQT